MHRDHQWLTRAREITATYGVPYGATNLSMVGAAIGLGLEPQFVNELIASVIAGDDGAPLALHVLQFSKPRHAAQTALRGMLDGSGSGANLIGWWSVLRACARRDDFPQILQSFHMSPLSDRYLWAGVLVRLVADNLVTADDEADIRAAVVSSADPLSIEILIDGLGPL